jgi:hypothetical protein
MKNKNKKLNIPILKPYLKDKTRKDIGDKKKQNLFTLIYKSRIEI